MFSEGDGSSVEFIIPRGGQAFSNSIEARAALHHIALEVPDLEELQRELTAKGVKLLETTPVDAGDIRINFLPPIYSRGVIVEYVERK